MNYVIIVTDMCGYKKDDVIIHKQTLHSPVDGNSPTLLLKKVGASFQQP